MPNRCLAGQEGERHEGRCLSCRSEGLCCSSYLDGVPKSSTWHTSKHTYIIISHDNSTFKSKNGNPKLRDLYMHMELLVIKRWYIIPCGWNAFCTEHTADHKTKEISKQKTPEHLEIEPVSKDCKH